MPENFRKMAEAKLDSYRAFALRESFRRCRLVQYVSVECSAIDVPLSDVESQIHGCLAEGFFVDWAVHDETLYLRVWEDPEPDWEFVFEERSIPIYSENGQEIDLNNLEEQDM